MLISKNYKDPRLRTKLSLLFPPQIPELHSTLYKSLCQLILIRLLLYTLIYIHNNYLFVVSGKSDLVKISYIFLLMIISKAKEVIYSQCKILQREFTCSIYQFQRDNIIVLCIL
jgi:hypothetical protein